MTIKFLDLFSQYQLIQNEIDEAFHSVIQDSDFIGGSHVQTFEKAFAHYVQQPYCVGVANGTDALEIAIEALNLPKNSDIIVPANSFISSAESVTRSGHRVVFADCDSKDYTLSVQSVASLITSNTSAIIPVHLYGYPCDMTGLMTLANTYGLKVIEDCAQAHGALYQGRPVGSFGDIATFSFYPGKNLGAYGDAGAIVTGDALLANTCKMIANHGRLEKYNHLFEGRNSRLDGLQAAILSVKLRHLPSWTSQRQALAKQYQQGLLNCPHLVLPDYHPDRLSVYHLFVIRTPFRDLLKKALADQDIQTGIHYPIALPKLPAYHYLNQDFSSFFACQSDTQLLSLPIGEHLQETEIQTVCKVIQEVLSCV